MPSPPTPSEAYLIAAPATPAQWTQARRLVQDYLDSLHLDLSFQDVEGELARFETDYAPPRGAFRLACDRQGRPAAVVGLRAWSDQIAEMKRLYVAPEHRGQGLGARLVAAIVEAARSLGYRSIWLDTLPDMQDAQDLYRRVGFVDIPAYRDNPVPGTRYLALDLRLSACQADITRLEVDVIVNAANSTLLGGGGVDGAIHRAAGPALLRACQPLAPCLPGQAKITPGFDLPARWVVHTVGPIWRGGQAGEADLLASCYAESLALAAAQGAASVAFPCISTGVYGYPADQAAAIAVSTVRRALDRYPGIARVIFCCFSAADLARYQSLLADEPHLGEG